MAFPSGGGTPPVPLGMLDGSLATLGMSHTAGFVNAVDLVGLGMITKPLVTLGLMSAVPAASGVILADWSGGFVNIIDCRG